MSYLDSGDPALHDDRRFSLEVALEFGRYPDKSQAKKIRSLLVERKFREVFDLIEAAAELPPKDDMYFLHMGDVAELLDLPDRAAYYHRRYEARYESVEPLFEHIEAAVRATCSAAEGMLSVIDFCSEARPHDDWRHFRAFDFDGDVAHVADWLQTLRDHAPPPEAIDGLWFGLFNPIRDGEATADMYVGGGEDATEDPDAWAEKLTWTPDGDASSQVLDGIYRVAYDHGTDGLGNDAEHPLCLTYACLTVRWLATTLPPALLLGDAEERVIQVGFDSGDFLRIGRLTSEGLTLPRDGTVA